MKNSWYTLYKNFITQPTTLDKIQSDYIEEIKPDNAVTEMHYQIRSCFLRNWKRFRSYVKDSDELYEFETPDYTWDSSCSYGRKGILLVRDGKVIKSFLTFSTASGVIEDIE